MDYEKLFNSAISGEAAKLWRAEGKKALGVICCHMPPEILRAADILPIHLRATGCVDCSDGETWMSTFSCSFARSILQYWLDGVYNLDGIAATDGCLMASRLYDNAKHIDSKENNGKFFIQIGAPRKVNDLTIQYFVNEFKDLIAEIEKLTGNKVTDEKIKEFVGKYNEARRLVDEIYELRKVDHPVISGEDALKITMAATDIPIEEYIELLKAFLADVKNRTPITDKRARLMIIGSAMDNPEYLKIMEDKGGLFVCDTLCYGYTGFGPQLELDDNDVLGSVAKYYLERIVCPRMMDDRCELDNYIVNLAKEYRVDGVIYQKLQYCECWGGQGVLLEDMLKDIDIPILTVEREEHLSNEGQLAIRAEAFIEMIEMEG